MRRIAIGEFIRNVRRHVWEPPFIVTRYGRDMIVVTKPLNTDSVTQKDIDNIKDNPKK